MDQALCARLMSNMQILCQFKNLSVCEHRQISGFCFSPPVFFESMKQKLENIHLCWKDKGSKAVVATKAEFLLHSSSFHFVQLICW